MPIRKAPIRRDGPLVLPRRVHVLGICGRMVGGLALVLKSRGVKVTGSDEMQFAPMPGVLRDAGMTVHTGWAAAHLPRQVDAIVVGALVSRGNPEYEAALERGVPVWNATAFLEHYFLRSAPANLLVVGTKGKTTTTAMLAWILEQVGKSPDYLIGGQVRGEMGRLRLTGAEWTVLEGDEFWCGGSDPVAKFLRYHPRHLVVTNVSHDHREIYPTRELYAAAFRQIVDLVPRNGSLVFNADDSGAMALVGRTPTPVQRVGFSRQADCRITRCRAKSWGMEFHLKNVPFRISLSGQMHVSNAALAAVAAGQTGVSLADAAAALETFPGLEGRQELLAQRGKQCLYYDDVYLPMAVKASLAAIRQRHPRQRLVCFFIPRYTGGRLADAQRELPDSLAVADVVVISNVLDYPIPTQPFSQQQLVRDLRTRGVEAYAAKHVTKLAGWAAKICRPDDVVLLALCLGADAFAQDIKQAIFR